MCPSLVCGAAVLAAVQAVQGPGGDEFAALRDCATVRIAVEQSYSEDRHGKPVTEVTLPFREVARALFEGAGLKTVAAGEADVVVTIRSAGEARATTGGEPVFYPWARVTGTVTIEARGRPVHQERFDNSSRFLPVGTPLHEWQQEPQSAPFMEAFVGDVESPKDSHLVRTLRLAARIYGPKALVAAIGDFRQIDLSGNDGMQLLTRVLGETRDPSAVAPLIELLKDPRAQGMAARQLGALREPRAVEALIPLLAARNSSVRCETARALGQIDDARGVEPLIANLKDPEAGDGCAAEALAKFRDARVIDALTGGLKGNRNVRIGAARALRDLADPRAVEPLIVSLIAALPDRDDGVMQEVAQSLGAIPDPRSIEPVLACLKVLRDGPSRWPVVASLGKILSKFPEPRAVEPLIAAFERDNSPTFREGLLKAIAPIPDERVFAFLITCLKDRDSIRGAADALSVSKDPRVVDTLLAALQDPASREGALAALGGFGQPRVTQALLAAVIDPDRFIRHEAASSLGKIKDPATIPPLIALLRHKTTNDAAALALREITGQDLGFDQRKWSQWWERNSGKRR